MLYKRNGIGKTADKCIITMEEWTFLFVCLAVSVEAYEKSTISHCLWHNNTCIDVCPEGMIKVQSNCNKTYWKAQRTCESPDVTLLGTVCGFSRCDCPDPMVLDTETGYCYDVDNCPTKHALL